MPPICWRPPLCKWLCKWLWMKTFFCKRSLSILNNLISMDGVRMVSIIWSWSTPKKYIKIEIVFRTFKDMPFWLHLWVICWSKKWCTIGHFPWQQARNPRNLGSKCQIWELLSFVSFFREVKHRLCLNLGFESL